MRPRQSVWKWLLAGLIAVIAAGLVFVLLRPAGPPSDLRGRVEASLSDWTGGTVRLNEPLRVRYLPPSLEGGLSLTEAKALPTLQSLNARKFRLTLSLPELLMGNVVFSALRLDEPTLRLQPGDGVANAEAVLGRLTAFLAEAPLETVRIHRGLVESDTGRPLLRALDLRLDTRGRLGELGAVGSFTFNGEPLTFSLDRGKTEEIETGHSAPLTLKVTSTPFTARFSGTMQLGESPNGERLGGDGNLEAELPDIRRFLAWVGMVLPQSESPSAAKATGRVHWTGPTLTFDDGAFEFDGNDAVGLLAVTVAARPRVDGTLAFETLALDSYLAREETAPPNAPPFDSLLLKHVDADLRISAAELSAGDLQLGGGGFTVNAKNGAISSEIGSLEICDGQAAGRLHLDLSGPHVKAALVGSLANIALDACRQLLGMGVAVTGSGTVKADISTGGTSYDDLMRGLAGTVVVTAQDGTLPMDMTALLSAPDAKANGWNDDTDTEFSEIDADCRLSAGYLRCKTFHMKTADKLFSGAGSLDVARQTLNWDLRVADPEAAPDADEASSETEPGITISGSLTTPQMARSHAQKPESATPDQDTETP